MEVVENDADLLVVTEGGYGKRTPLIEYHPKGRGSQGLTTINQNKMDLIGQIAAARVVKNSDDLTLISSNGVMLRVKVNKLSRSGRSTQGIPCDGLGEGRSRRIAGENSGSIGRTHPGMTEPVLIFRTIKYNAKTPEFHRGSFTEGGK